MTGEWVRKKVNALLFQGEECEAREGWTLLLQPLRGAPASFVSFQPHGLVVSSILLIAPAVGC